MQAAPPTHGAATPTLTVLAALSKSRQTLLTTALPLFSTKSRSKTAPQLVQSQHTISLITTTAISIGPHSFTKTKLFFVQWEGKKLSTPKPAPAPAPAAAGNANGAITPALIMRLNAASAADPLLAAILRKAAAGQASPSELQGLARYIETMRREEDADNARAAAQAAASTSALVEEPIRQPSIVLEFKESTTERFILPEHFTFELLPALPGAPPSRRNVMLSFFVFPQASSDVQQEMDLKGKGKELGVPAPITLIVEDCTETVRDYIRKASRTGREADAQTEAWWKKMIQEVAPRVLVVTNRITEEPKPSPAPPTNLGKRPADDSRESTPVTKPKRRAAASKGKSRASIATEPSSPRSSSPAATPARKRVPPKKRHSSVLAASRGSAKGSVVKGKKVVDHHGGATPAAAAAMAQAAGSSSNAMVVNEEVPPVASTSAIEAPPPEHEPEEPISSTS